jgi:hypothetical protein
MRPLRDPRSQPLLVGVARLAVLLVAAGCAVVLAIIVSAGEAHAQDVGVGKNGSASATAGTDLTYTITVASNGPSTTAVVMR